MPNRVSLRLERRLSRFENLENGFELCRAFACLGRVPANTFELRIYFS
jgi:hypothetical protein